MEPIKSIESRTVVLPYSDIDTDQILPARFLTTTTREGLGAKAFADWRYDSNGEPKPDFVLNSPEAAGCEVLVTGRNFGCGSSREHAPWALLDYGFKAVISSDFADIFRNNSLKNGLLPVVVDPDTHAWLLDNPGVRVTVDLENTTLTLPTGRTVDFPIESFARYCLLNGTDQLGYLLNQEHAIAQYERSHA
ncbi:MAG TPA: 3-isopropylmalate dehydratase small subunit [Steroidobacteraceae bacterium]|nr:3-isopropylmalate dehydratase small subunit [Steroidobacteraceae bacterium]